VVVAGYGVVKVIYFMLILDILVFHFLVLVGAFSDFGRADTGKPVQNLPEFSKSEARLGI